MYHRISRIIAVLAFACLTVAGAGTAGAGEQGGSGLVGVDQAFSLDIGRPLVNTHIGYFSRDFTGGSDRFYTFTPSLTLGLGAGFEGSAALAFEGLSSKLENEAFDRRFDLRRRDLTTRLRWTAPLGTTRLRAGVEGLLGLPLGDAIRAGGTIDPSRDYDIGVMGLLSTNLGWFNFPLRLHANAGYWWSRDDGAFYDRSHPLALPISGPGAVGNDLALYGVALETGLRRVSLFTELVTEQFIDARGAVKAQENLWQLTPGLRTKLTPTIELTAAISFNLSKDDPSTVFNPDVVYPDHELRVALTLGDILARERSESRQLPREDEPMAITPEPVAATAKAAAEATAPSAAVIAPENAPAAPKAAKPTAPPQAEPAADASAAPAMEAAPGPDLDAARLRMIEDRLERLELQNRMAGLEARLDKLEGRTQSASAAPAPPAATKTAPVGKAQPAAAPAAAPAVADSSVAVTVAPEPRPSAAAVQPKAAAVPTGTVVPEKAATVPTAPATVAPPAPATIAPPVPVTVAPPALVPAAPDTAAAAAQEALSRRLAAVEAMVAASRAADLEKKSPVPAAEPAKATGTDPALESRLASIQASMDSLRTASATASATATAAAAARTTKASAPAPVRADDESVAMSPGLNAGSTVREWDLTNRIAMLEAELAAARAAPTAVAVQPSAREDALAKQIAQMQIQISELNEARAAAATPVVVKPAPEAAPVKPASAPAVAPEPAKAPQHPFFLAVGEKRMLAGPARLPAGGADSTFVSAVLDTLAADLRAHRDVRIVLMVHGSGTDREAELTRTETAARSLRDYLVRHGAEAGQVQPLGMGLSEPLHPLDGPQAAENLRIEVARVY